MQMWCHFKRSERHDSNQSAAQLIAKPFRLVIAITNAAAVGPASNPQARRSTVVAPTENKTQIDRARLVHNRRDQCEDGAKKSKPWQRDCCGTRQPASSPRNPPALMTLAIRFAVGTARSAIVCNWLARSSRVLVRSGIAVTAATLGRHSRFRGKQVGALTEPLPAAT